MTKKLSEIFSSMDEVKQFVEDMKPTATPEQYDALKR